MNEQTKLLHHVYKDGPKCVFERGNGTFCGKEYREGGGRHVIYGPDWEKPGYHQFEPEQIHDEENCALCKELKATAALVEGLKELLAKWDAEDLKAKEQTEELHERLQRGESVVFDTLTNGEWHHEIRADELRAALLAK